MTQVNNWIIGLIDRLYTQFPHCGFAYAYETSSDQHVVELTDADTRISSVFRESLLDELDTFNALFVDACILFTDQKNDFPLEPPILYKKQPVLESTLAQPYRTQAGYSSVSWMHEWPLEDISSNEVLNSVIYSVDVQRQATITVKTKPIVVGEYNYGMAA